MTLGERLKQSLAVGAAGAVGSVLSDLNHVGASLRHDAPIVFGIVTAIWFVGLSIRDVLGSR
ncbi:hypothetical protein FHS95_003373 [Sphingomonas naasensis]|uniref:Uncharacterized protein n=1 Tax=Sphingomonas naasensis TaxID=1344951 RepID=A0A4S1WI97_9SPHN|nr:hypothetical protein [Sphingomonas naasensis]NIJ21670.1 hypothetical protein [Sphingomonas naasensis]TGX41400.1 hypothetical protein E5A74_12235 [Sphingomonas naasensis]